MMGHQRSNGASLLGIGIAVLLLLLPDFAEAAVEGWANTTNIGAPSVRRATNPVWTGSEMIVWGDRESINYINTGGRYNPITDTWTATSVTPQTPTPRRLHAITWVNNKMLVWGGKDNLGNRLNTGALYNPVDDSWTPTTTVGAPIPLASGSIVSMGTKAIVWGGRTSCCTSGMRNEGGIYDAANNTWTLTTTFGAPAARMDHAALWLGNKMMIFGGLGTSSYNALYDGALYNPTADSWQTMPSHGAASPGGEVTSLVWTGTEVLAWGSCPSYSTCVGGGKKYDPTTNQWTGVISTLNEPSARVWTHGIWTGMEMIIWGGGTISGSFNYLNDGKRYDPVADTWTTMTMTGAPVARRQHATVWTGNEMIVWGGRRSPGVEINTGAKYTSPVGCIPSSGVDTTCDGVDDDCDGTKDEDYVAQPTTCGTGACLAAGSTSCVLGSVIDSCVPGCAAASIDLAPSRMSNTTSADFTLSTSFANPQFNVRVDGGAWSGWSALASINIPGPLTSGIHQFEVLSRNGVSLAVDPSPATYTWRVVANTTQTDFSIAESDYWIYGGQMLGFFGFAVSAGNINGDSSGLNPLDDAAIGAPTTLCADSITGGCGQVSVVLGSTGLTGGRDLATTPADLTVYGAGYNNQLGSAVAIGDINGDACDELIMSAPWASPGGKVSAGAIYILFGRRFGGCAVNGNFPGTWDLANTPADVTLYGASAGDELGLHLAVGDINGDGIGDLLASSPYAFPGGRAKAGTGYAVIGRASWPAVIDLNTAGSVVRIHGRNAGDAMTLADASDVNGDGPEDILVLASGGSAAYVVPGSGGYVVGASFDVDLSVGTPASAALTSITAASGTQLVSMSGRGNFDGDLASGGNPLNDLVIGATGAAGGAGRVYLVAGSESMTPTVDLGMNPQTVRVRVTGENPTEELGISVLVYDFNNDGIDDLSIGSTLGDERGQVQILYGTSFDINAKIDLYPTGTAPDRSPRVYKGRGPSANYGYSQAAGDFNGDGIGDLLSGSIFSSGNGTVTNAWCGEAHIMLGSSGQ